MKTTHLARSREGRYGACPTVCGSYVDGSYAAWDLERVDCKKCLRSVNSDRRRAAKMKAKAPEVPDLLCPLCEHPVSGSHNHHGCHCPCELTEAEALRAAQRRAAIRGLRKFGAGYLVNLAHYRTMSGAERTLGESGRQLRIVMAAQKTLIRGVVMMLFDCGILGRAR